MSLRVPVVPAIFSGLRIASGPLLVYLVAVRPMPRAAFWVCLAAAATDYADGWAARRLSCKTYGGKILDFTADKIFLIVALLSMASAGYVDATVAGVVVAYHLLVIMAITVVSWSVSTPMVPVPTAERLVVTLSYVLVISLAGSRAFPGKGIYSTLSWVGGILAMVSLLAGVVGYLRLIRRLLARYRR
jgi:phosphatidylglycerophosphate synthase